jgi:2,3-bisphosphoglycerate-independent phosphoglycerate mutase
VDSHSGALPGPEQTSRAVDAPNRGVKRPAALIILDGWGEAPPGPANAISQARTPVWDSLLEQYPHTLVDASGEAVGLPPGVMGNSEVGHLTLGAGRVIYQDLSRINRAISDGSFFDNPVLAAAMDGAVNRGRAVHLMGLLSDGRVHSSLDHLQALVRMAMERHVTELYIHAFMDGRDTPPIAGEGFLSDLDEFLAVEGLGQVVSVMGRYYAMDRDRRWERVKQAYDTLVRGFGLCAADPITGIRSSYENGETDEFVKPFIVCGEPAGAAAPAPAGELGAGGQTGGPAGPGRMRTGDAVIFFNFRPDRARELTRALTEASFDCFDRGDLPPALHVVGFTEYDPDLNIGIAFPKEEPRMVLAEVLSLAGLTQLHIAETEKYAHVTFFFNGGREDPYPGEIRRLIQSPKEVATYDQKPAMSAYEVARVFAETMAEQRIDFVVLNFANPDMVGHTGDLAATIQAVEDVDVCLGEVLEVLRRHHARVVVTSDHGNAEEMVEPDGSENTAHSTHRVPLVVLEKGLRLREGAGLADVAPTILSFLGLNSPMEMTGHPLVGGYE